MHGCDPVVEGAILLSPPLRFATEEHLATWAESGKPLVALVPEHDDYLRPPEAEERFAAVPQAEVVGVEGAKHLWVGDAETVLDVIVQRVAPGGRRTPAAGVGRPDGDRGHQRATPTGRPRSSRTDGRASCRGRTISSHEQQDGGRGGDGSSAPTTPEQGRRRPGPRSR